MRYVTQRNRENKMEKDLKKVDMKYEYLPQALISSLKENLIKIPSVDYRTKNNFIKCVALIYRKQISDGLGYFGFAALGSAYWKKVFGNDYRKKVLEPLLELRIIQAQDFGYRNFDTKDSLKAKIKGNVGIRYRINPELFSDECEVIYYNTNNKLIPIEKAEPNSSKDSKQVSSFNNELTVGIYREKALEYIEACTESIVKEYLKPDIAANYPDDYIIGCHIWQNHTINTVYLTVQAAKQYAEKRNLKLFYFKDSFFIANAEEFLKQKADFLRYNYLREVSKVGKLQLQNRRSLVNLRLHNYLVNFPSHLLPYISLNNRTIVQFDLTTSQFLLLANLINVYLSVGGEALMKRFKHKQTQAYLKKFIAVLDKNGDVMPKKGIEIKFKSPPILSNSDISLFIQDVFFDDFYTVVQKHLNLADRDIAKQTLFTLLFRKNTKSNKLIERLQERYPLTISIINEFKGKSIAEQKNTDKLNSDDNNLAIFLQCVESEIFIDNILFPIRESRIPCFSRHDSICVASGYEELVEEKIKLVFSDLGFQLKLKSQEMFYEIYSDDELEESGFNDCIVNLQDEIDFVDKNCCRFSEDSFKDRDNQRLEFEDNNEISPELFDMLWKVGIRDDYSDVVGVDMLHELLQVPFLNKKQKNIIENEIENMRIGMSFFQNETNEVIGRIAQYYQNIFN